MAGKVNDMDMRNETLKEERHINHLIGKRKKSLTTMNEKRFRRNNLMIKKLIYR